MNGLSKHGGSSVRKLLWKALKKKTGFSSKIDGTKDGMLWDVDNEENDVSGPDVHENSDDSDENDRMTERETWNILTKECLFEWIKQRA